MKKINLLPLVLLALLLSNCSNDDDNSNSKEMDFSGDWIGTKFLVNEAYDFNNDGIPSRDYKIELPCLIQNITLNPDGTGLFKANIHGQAEGQTTPFPLTCVEYEENPMTWSLNEEETKILLRFSETVVEEFPIVSEVVIERFSESLLDDTIGIPGKVVYEKQTK
ncbi:hypothetical protein [Aquimarina agarilytica]|uniref:hypothetical protein n=1 Tax=Aquimarina agarilytica TaxID=1087449 RepID=UPI000288F656|nr:hypothetical protein [Aquimarina agarilytica]